MWARTTATVPVMSGRILESRVVDSWATDVCGEAVRLWRTAITQSLENTNNLKQGW